MCCYLWQDGNEDNEHYNFEHYNLSAATTRLRPWSVRLCFFFGPLSCPLSCPLSFFSRLRPWSVRLFFRETIDCIQGYLCVPFLSFLASHPWSVALFFQCRGRCDESEERLVGVFLACLFCFYDRSLLTGLFYFHVCHLPHHCSCFTDAILFVHQVPCFLYKNYAINNKEYEVRVIVIYSIIFCTTNPIFLVQKSWENNKEC
jgi:hypothetical protein